MYCVYKHTAPNGKIYIGITGRNPLRRWNNGNGYRNNPHFWNAIKKYGWKNIRHEILLDGLAKEEAERHEILLIKSHDSANPLYGYNKSSGGGCNTGYTWRLSETQRKNQSNAQKRIHAEGRGNVFKNQSGSNNAFYGHRHSAEARDKISKAQYNPVLKYSKNGEVLAEYDNPYQAQIQTGAKHVLECCKGLRKTAGGYHWKYKEE